MAKFKKFVVGCGVVVISSVMWAVAACSQLATKPVSNIQPPSSSPTSAASPTTAESPNLSESTPATSSAAAEAPSAANSTPATSTTTTLPPVVNNSPPTTSAPFDTDINDYRLAINGLVNTPLSLSYTQILSYVTVTQNAELFVPVKKM